MSRGTMLGTQTWSTTITVLTCPTCGMPFGISVDFERRRRADHQDFYCPAGHEQGFYGKSKQEQEIDRLRDERAQADRRRRLAEDSERFYRDQATAARRSAAAHKGHATRIRNMIANGVCPVPGCHRSFTNVRRHMATKHPDYHTHEATS
ncbi:hypothetical protein OEB99_16700 [Actinotalea sp. M2MS4P-6]|uniref:hypothetical protein n=1 Tax=Actinotalea sp. M2MS4P-6 TaxID=2983762 RepID=UPI0021E39ED2|nr:hypothetical protein [Actinotalea sp. M2MS4P-6]MCV2395957.1 hypothetical protein [Actinotalea sp. M2MS4P-6]